MQNDYGIGTDLNTAPNLPTNTDRLDSASNGSLGGSAWNKDVTASDVSKGYQTCTAGLDQHGGYEGVFRDAMEKQQFQTGFLNRRLGGEDEAG